MTKGCVQSWQKFAVQNSYFTWIQPEKKWLICTCRVDLAKMASEMDVGRRRASRRKDDIIIIIIYALTARVVWAPQMIFQPVSSIFPCSPLLSGTLWTPGLSIPWFCLPTSSSVCLVFFPFSLCLVNLLGQPKQCIISTCVWQSLFTKTPTSS